MLLYPPGSAYQRGEDRSQGNVEGSTATSVRACNDLGYAASTLKQGGFEVFLRDYQTEQLDFGVLLADFESFSPDAAFLSITNATIFEDLSLVRRLKQINPDLVVLLKGALFYAPEPGLLQALDLSDVTYLVGGESDFIVADLLERHFAQPESVSEVPGILHRVGDRWQQTQFFTWEEDLDRLPMPDRHLMKNELYVRPDTGEPQATIVTSRGCNAACVFCLTPQISGTRIRSRSPESVFAEVRECVSEHGIRNFFFRSDTFTRDRKWVEQLCDRIVRSDLRGKIAWVANSRTRPLHPETLQAMKDAGCWLVAFGFESGSQETMRRLKKGTTVDDSYLAAEYARAAGLKMFGFYLVGLPWESQAHLAETKRLMFDISADYVEVHLALPYRGTELCDLAQEEGLLPEALLGRDYFDTPVIGTRHLTAEQLAAYRKRVLLEYHLRPRYLITRAREVLHSPRLIRSYGRFGWRLLKNTMTLRGTADAQ
jgi:radical SAM superfamily enzyme YgiQ (UPF0313 family)